MVIDAYVQEAVIAARLDRRFEGDLKVGDTLNRGTITKATVTARTAGNNLTPTNSTETTKQLIINQDYYVFRMLEPATKIQANIDVFAEYLKEDSKALAEYVDNYIGDLFPALNGTTAKGTVLVDVEDDNLLDCVQVLDDAVAPKTDRSWFVSPATFNSLMKIDKFVRMDYVNPTGGTAVERAQLNYPIYGAPVFVTTAVGGDNTNGHNNALIQKEAIMLIMQQEPKVVKAWDTRAGMDTMLIEAIWGAVEARDTSGCCLNGK